MRKYLTILIIFCSFQSLFSQNVSLETAKSVAEKWYKHNAPVNKRNEAISKTIEYKYDNTTRLYVFGFDKGGFVLVSSDYQSKPV